MIIVHLAGGLGNQLFQYAYGRALAKSNNSALKLDLSMFEHYEWHEYSLKPFDIKATIASKAESQIMKGENLSFYTRIKRKIFAKPVVLQEENLLFNSNYLNLKDPAYLAGYWQSEKYFSAIDNLIREDFQITVPPSPANQKMLTRIKRSNAVSLHIRRGNYVQIDFVNTVHGTCSMEYYTEAMDLMSSKVSNPVAYIFSDDIPWAKENLHLKFETVFVDINDAKTDYEDLRLMSACRHHILANSTFSWWGAWLNNDADKMVIAPKIWFADNSKNDQTTDLIPKEWVRI